jgi:hypothetical protein
MKGRNSNWIGHTFSRNCLLKHDIEGKKERTGRRGITRKQLPDDIQEGGEYWKLIETVPYRTRWRNLY